MEKEQISAILFFYAKRSCSRSHHLVLWSLGTLTSQQRFYGTGLITQKERCYHSWLKQEITMSQNWVRTNGVISLVMRKKSLFK